MEYGRDLRTALSSEARPLCFAGVYDVLSASIAARYFDGIFVSGFSFAASFYGLPDVGFIAWPDIVNFTQRLRAVLPDTHILVDIDDGYVDVEVACHVTKLLEAAGASGVILEDQQRPRKCGHLDNKNILDLDVYLEKLNSVLAARSELVVVARTDAATAEDRIRRASAFAATSADAILMDGLGELSLIQEASNLTSKPLVFNQMVGGRGSEYSVKTLGDAGVSVVIYSTPCLFAAQDAMEQELEKLRTTGLLPAPTSGRIGLNECNELLNTNLTKRLCSSTPKEEQNDV